VPSGTGDARRTAVASYGGVTSLPTNELARK